MWKKRRKKEESGMKLEKKNLEVSHTQTYTLQEECLFLGCDSLCSCKNCSFGETYPYCH